jgi:hypothetical protein
MEATRSDDPSLNPIRNRNPNPNPNPNPLSTIISSAQVWPTIDGPLGLTEEASVDYARRFYKFGFALLPWLWFVNCFYFWPVLRHSRAFPQIRNCKFLFDFVFPPIFVSGEFGNVRLGSFDLALDPMKSYNFAGIYCFSSVIVATNVVLTVLNLMACGLQVSYSN